MSIRDKAITLQNYNPFTVFIPTQTGRTFSLDPCINNIPTLVTIQFNDCEYVNGQSSAFRTGLLIPKLNKEENKEFYETLNIYNYEDILTNDKIEKILKKPTLEGLTKILEIEDDSLFERVRTILIKLKNLNGFNISTKVIDLVNIRYSELKKGKKKTEYVIQESHLNNDIISSETVEQLKEQKAKNEQLEKELNEIKANMAKLMQLNSTSIEDNKTEVNEKKTAGRPKQNK